LSPTKALLVRTPIKTINHRTRFKREFRLEAAELRTTRPSSSFAFPRREREWEVQVYLSSVVSVTLISLSQADKWTVAHRNAPQSGILGVINHCFCPR